MGGAEGAGHPLIRGLQAALAGKRPTKTTGLGPGSSPGGRQRMGGQEGNHGAISARLDYTAPAPPGACLWDGQDVAHGARRTM